MLREISSKSQMWRQFESLRHRGSEFEYSGWLEEVMLQLRLLAAKM